MKKLIPHKKLFTTNERGEYWQSRCMICTGDVFAFRVEDVHYIFEDKALIGRPICTDCFEGLKVKIPTKIDLIKKHEIERIKSLPERIFDNIEKTHRPYIKNNLDKWF